MSSRSALALAVVLALTLGLTLLIAALLGCWHFIGALRRSSEGPLIESHWGGYGGGLGGWRMSRSVVYLFAATACGAVAVVIGFQGLAQVPELAKALSAASTQPAPDEKPVAPSAPVAARPAGPPSVDAATRPSAATAPVDAAASRPTTAPGR